MALQFLYDGYFAGKVGIGTESPTANLHVQGSSATDVPIIRSGGFGNSGSTLELAETLVSGNMTYGFSFEQTGNGTNELLIKRHNNSQSGAPVITLSRTNNNVSMSGGLSLALKATSSSTLSTDGGTTLTTKNYVDETTAGYRNLTFVDGTEKTDRSNGVPAPSRTSNPDPQDYDRVFSTEFKNSANIGSPVGNAWAGLISMAPYNVGSSGFKTTQLAFAASGSNTDLYIRQGAATTWGNWSKILTETNSGAGPFLPLVGGTLSGTLNITQTTSDFIDLTRDLATDQTWRQAISGAGSFSLYDVTRGADVFVLDTSGDATFTGNTFVNAQLAVNSTTVNAANKLEVHGQARVVGAMMIGDSSTANVAAGGQLHIKNSGEAVIRLEDSDLNNFAFDIKVNEGEGFAITESIGGQAGGDNDRLVIQETTGNVRIGTTSVTTHKLIVSGGSNIASFRSEGSGQNLKKLSISTGGDRVVLDASTTTDTTAAFAFQTGGVERMRILDLGGIKFNAYDSTNNTGTPTYMLGTDASGNVVKVLGGDIPGSGGANNWTLSGTDIYNNNSGDVVVGGTSSNYKFGVTGGNIGVSNGGNIYVGGFGADAVIGYLGNTSGVFTLRSDGNRDISIGSGTVNNSVFIEGSNGNIGIGTTSPGRKLSVNGSIELTGSDMTLNTTSAAIRRGTSGQMFLDAPGDVTVTIDSNSNNTDRVFNVRKDTDSELFRIQENGNVGIGTTSPNSKLQIVGKATSSSTVSTDAATTLVTKDYVDSSAGNPSHFRQGHKSHNLTNAFTTCLTVSLSNHTGCYVTVCCFGDWGSHSSAAYRGEFFLQNGANAYNEPGIILRQDDNTSNGTDQIVCQILDPTSGASPKNFEIQIRTTATTGTTGFTGLLTFTVQGQFNSVT